LGDCTKQRDWNTDLLCESATSRYSRRKFSTDDA
jgi:hypothetical protein